MVMEKKMSRREFLKVSAATGAILSMAPTITLAEEPKPIQLLTPQPGGGSPLMQLLWKRKSSREFSPETFARRGSFKSPVGGLRDQSA